MGPPDVGGGPRGTTPGDQPNTYQDDHLDGQNVTTHITRDAVLRAPCSAAREDHPSPVATITGSVGSVPSGAPAVTPNVSTSHPGSG